MTCVVARRRQTMRTRKRKGKEKKEKRKIDCHALEKNPIKSKQESRKQKNVEIMMKNCIHMNHFFPLARNHSSV